MVFEQFFYIFVGGLPVGLLCAMIWDHLEKKLMLQRTKTEAENILQETQEETENRFEKQDKELKALQETKLNLFEKQKEKTTSQLQQLQAKVDKRTHHLKLKNKEHSSLTHKMNNKIREIKRERTMNLKQKEELNKNFKHQLQQQNQLLEAKFYIDTEQLKQNLKKEIEEDWTDQIRNQLEKQDLQDKQNLQKQAFFYLNIGLNRFNQIYCPERGISPCSFKSKAHLKKIIGPNSTYLTEIEKECGVDILINEEDLQASIFGIDPVRRELGRISLKKLSNKNKIDIGIIKSVVKYSKKDLFSQIHRDGQAICRKLYLHNVAPEVKNMMGALRYRYSFAQNQYFHCEEVAWLCGLLNSELNLSIKTARRSGLFHDIGKAMDHSIEGSHAVIGAEFLSKYNEDKKIIHAVRAHHHDETPSTPLAYLVIAADAISGSRPGARRFTEDSYNQKMADLERIIGGFKHIDDSYIMSAGREMRVVVNSKKVSDKEALDLSKKIARQIEKECSYPGLIKVTVVRHSETVATA